MFKIQPLELLFPGHLSWSGKRLHVLDRLFELGLDPNEIVRPNGQTNWTSLVARLASDAFDDGREPVRLRSRSIGIGERGRNKCWFDIAIQQRAHAGGLAFEIARDPQRDAADGRCEEAQSHFHGCEACLHAAS